MPTLVLPARFQNAPYFGDYYLIMGLDKGRAPTSDDIKTAYHTRALQYHPDTIHRSTVSPRLSSEEATECFQALAEIKSILLSTCSEVIDLGNVERSARDREALISADDLSPGEQLKAFMLAYLRSARFCEYPPGIGPGVRGYWSYVVGGQNHVEIGTSRHSGMMAIATEGYQVECGNGWTDPVIVLDKRTRPFIQVTDQRQINTILANMASYIPKDRRDHCARVYGSHVRTQYLLEPVVTAIAAVASYTISDSYGDNYVDGVRENKDGSVTIFGRANDDGPREITLLPDGSAVGFRENSDLGEVGRQFYANREQILQHFNVHFSPPPLSQTKTVRRRDVKLGGAVEEGRMSRQEHRSSRAAISQLSPEALNADLYKEALIAYMQKTKNDIGMERGDWYPIVDNIEIGIGASTTLLSLSSPEYVISIDSHGELSFWDKLSKKVVIDSIKNSQILQHFVKAMKSFLVLDTPPSNPVIGPYTIEDSEGDNYVDGVLENTDGSVKIFGRANDNSSREITFYPDGSVLGFRGNPNLGSVGYQFYDNKAQIFQHFNFNRSQKKPNQTGQISLGAQEDTSFSSRTRSNPSAYAEQATTRPKSPIKFGRGGERAVQPRSSRYASDQKEARATQAVARSIEVEQVNAARMSGFDVPEPGVGQKSHLNCPAPILAAFKQTLTGADGLNILGGVVLNNPNGGPNVTLPTNISDLTPLHLQLLARNEAVNTDGFMKTELYQGLLDADQIARIRCLVKATNTSTVTRVHTIGGYPDGVSPAIQGTPNNTTVVIDQAGLQWQGDYRNTGGLFFYPRNPSDPRLPDGYAAWQNEMYQAMYGQYRPVESSANFMEVTWDTKNSNQNVRGRIDLDGVEMAISAEFSQAMAAAALQTRGSTQPVNFKFLKAGMGCFAEGIASASSRELARLEVARLKGIEQALINLSQLEPLARERMLGAVRAIELPFSASYDSDATAVLGRIKSLVTNMRLQWMGAEPKDALTLRPGYINALTNCGDPHAMIGNEGWYGSVDAMIRTNCDTTISHCDAWINPYITQHDNSILQNFDERRSASLSSGALFSSSASMREVVRSNRDMYGEQMSANRSRGISSSIHGGRKSVVHDKKAELSEIKRAEENPYIQIIQSMVNSWQGYSTPPGWQEFEASFNSRDGIEKIEQARAALFEIKASPSRLQDLFDALEKIELRINERLGNRPK